MSLLGHHGSRIASLFQAQLAAWPVSKLLFAFACGIVLPLVALSAIAILALEGSERQRYEERAVVAANETASVLDRELRGMLGALETLATSSQIDTSMPAFHDRATKVAKLLASNILVFDPLTGRQQVNTRVPFGVALPSGSDPRALQVARTGVPLVSGVFAGQIVKSLLFGVYVPVIRDGTVVAILSSAYEPSRLAALLAEKVNANGWIAVVTDDAGKIVARSSQHEKFVGKEVALDSAARVRAGEPIVARAPSLQGEPAQMAFARSSVTNWYVSILVPLPLIDAPLKRIWLYFSLLSAIALLCSLSLAALIGRYIARPVAAVADGARRLGRGEVPEAISSGLEEANAVSMALHQAGLRRRQRDEHIELLMREVNHRSKNLLGVVQAIARQTAKGQSQEFIVAFTERLGALAASHDLLVKSDWRGADLGELAHASLDHFKDLIGSRIDISGSLVQLNAAAAQTLGMAMHELATNSGKYGALSVENGRLEIKWNLIGEKSPGQRLALRWIETDGPPVVEPTRRGFGSIVVADMPTKALNAIVNLDYPPSGLRWHLDAPAATVLEGAHLKVEADSRHVASTTIKPILTRPISSG